jgi:predicted ribosome quality control (RQC) complex YloA/Tae2 family protein
MQPFDAVTMRAILQEAKPLLLNSRVDEIQQLGRDEITIALRKKGGDGEKARLIVSAHAVYGRICLSQTVLRSPYALQKNRRSAEARSPFFVLLKKYLSGATLIAVEQTPFERVCDFVFSCVDEVGRLSLKVLTAEIMGRHGNLIFWNHEDKTIIGASHLVTREMSRHREVVIGKTYVRPPIQEKPNLFLITSAELGERFEAWSSKMQALTLSSQQEKSAQAEKPKEPLAQQVKTAADKIGSREKLVFQLESFLLASYSGLGRALTRQLVEVAVGDNVTENCLSILEVLWRLITQIKLAHDFSPALKRDLSTYTIFAFALGNEHCDERFWKPLLTVNDLIDEYYRSVMESTLYRQTRDKMISEAHSQIAALEAKLSGIRELIIASPEMERAKDFADLILANLRLIAPGQSTLVCSNFYAEPPTELEIPLNSNLSGAQNAQVYYRQFVKARNRKRAADLIAAEVQTGAAKARAYLAAVSAAATIEELRALRIPGRLASIAETSEAPRHAAKAGSPKCKIMSLLSSDGWTIYAGRNRYENDYLLSHIAQPSDLWLHVLGQSGAHVVIKTDNGKNDPPFTTLEEAAQIAARLSKVTPGIKARVAYTHCRYVRKVSGQKARAKPGANIGLVRFEKEKTLTIDTGKSLPMRLKQALLEL